MQQISWSKEEKAMRKELYEEGIYMPEALSSIVHCMMPMVTVQSRYHGLSIRA
jgi:hypothetical protein